MNLKGAIFDLDGTLIDTEPIYFDAAEQLISQYGNGKKFGWDTKIKTLGSPELVTAQIVVDTFDIKLTAQEFLDTRNKITPEQFKKCPFIEGAKEITDKFKKELKYINDHVENDEIKVCTAEAYENFEKQVLSQLLQQK